MIFNNGFTNTFDKGSQQNVLAHYDRANMVNKQLGRIKDDVLTEQTLTCFTAWNSNDILSFSPHSSIVSNDLSDRISSQHILNNFYSSELHIISVSGREKKKVVSGDLISLHVFDWLEMDSAADTIFNSIPDRRKGQGRPGSKYTTYNLTVLTALYESVVAM